jgi:hypothetical protein
MPCHLPVPVFVLTSLLLTVVCPAEKSGDVLLREEAGRSVYSLYTPIRALHNGMPYKVEGESGTIPLAGRDVLVAARRDRRGRRFLAVDGDGDGQWSRSEWQTVTRTPMLVSIETSQGRTLPIVIERAFIDADNFDEPVRRIRLRCIPAWTMSGRIGQIRLRLLDANLDGQLTQDGDDAIVIGNGIVGQPLHEIHRIDGTDTRLLLAEDGRRLNYAELPPANLGRVETPLPPRALEGLVVANKDGHAYDIAVAGEAGIPAGQYRLVYGIITKGSAAALLDPPKRATFTIQAGRINTLQVGPPITLDFEVRCDEDGIVVRDRGTPVGAAGETYAFNVDSRTHDQATVWLISDDRTDRAPFDSRPDDDDDGRAARGTASDDDDKRRPRRKHRRDWPRGMTPAGTRVRLVRRLPVFGTVAGETPLAKADRDAEPPAAPRGITVKRAPWPDAPAHSQPTDPVEPQAAPPAETPRKAAAEAEPAEPPAPDETETPTGAGGW